MAVVNKRSVMTLYSNTDNLYGQAIRIVLAEKGVTFDVVNVDLDNKPEDLVDLNPYGSIPTLVDRELVLYHPAVIMEYLDERFPHPPLLPIYPVARAKSRLVMYRIDIDWYSLAYTILDPQTPTETAETARKAQTSSILNVAPIFVEMQYFLNEEFSLVDCCMASLLHRLPIMGITLPGRHGQLIMNYAERLFARESFKASLTNVEYEHKEEEYF